MRTHTYALGIIALALSLISVTKADPSIKAQPPKTVPATIFHTVEQGPHFDATADLNAAGSSLPDRTPSVDAAQDTNSRRHKKVDDVWCNHIITVDSQGFTDKILDCRTIAEWRAVMSRTPTR